MSQMTESSKKRMENVSKYFVGHVRDLYEQAYQAGMLDPDANSSAIVDHVALYERIGRALKDTGVPLTTHEMADARNVIRVFNKQKELLDDCEKVLLIAWGQLEAGCKEAEQVDQMIEKIREARKG